MRSISRKVRCTGIFVYELCIGGTGGGYPGVAGEVSRTGDTYGDTAPLNNALSLPVRRLFKTWY